MIGQIMSKVPFIYQQVPMVEDGTPKMKFLFFGKEIHKTDLTSLFIPIALM